MARTKQTARKSIGGKAPRQIIHGHDQTSQSTLVSLYNETQTRTIAVTGTDEFDVEVDTVSMSFKIMEEDLDYQQAIVSTLSTLDFVRNEVKSLGVSNEFISSDALRVQQRRVSMRNGEVVPIEDSDDDNNANIQKTVEQGKEDGETTIVTVYQPTIILRVQLAANTVPLFPRIMFTLLQMGIPNYESPVYDSSILTEHRHQARENAVLNAQDKAKSILNSLDSDVCVGKPLTVNDIHVDPYDIHESDQWTALYPNIYSDRDRRVTPAGLKKSSITKPEDRKQLFSDALLERIDDLFVIPPIRISGQINCIFEVVSGEGKGKSEGEVEEG